MFGASARAGDAEPPGPVHLDLPKTFRGQCERIRRSRQVRGKLPDLSNEMIQAISVALEKARRPLVITGLSFNPKQGAQWLLQFIETHKIPFVTTLHGKGFFRRARSLGRRHRPGAAHACKAFMDRADLILAVGYDPIEINYEEWAAKFRSSISAPKAPKRART